MAGDAIVIGSGAAGSVAAWELARNGWSVTVLERGRHMREGFGKRPSSKLGTRYGSDDIKTARQLGFPHPLLEPYTGRSQAEAADGVPRSAKGALGQLGAAVGGTTLHYNAKFPRFWKQDFKTLSELGPMPGANVADWPIDYDDLAPYYDEVEIKTGVQGDYAAMPARSREQSPHKGPYIMGPQPISLAGKLVADAGEKLGYTAFPQAAAVNSRRYQNRPPCVSCGMCSGWGCGINARGDALVSWLNPAVRMGDVRVIARAFVDRIETTRNGRRATAVHYVDHRGRGRRISADIVIVAGSPINTARLLLLSDNKAHPKGLGNGSDQVGRNMMFHNFTLAAAVCANEVHPLRAQSNSLQVDDLMGPFKGVEVQALGVPWLKGGLVQVGGGVPLFSESGIYSMLQAWGGAHKQLMKLGVLHRRVAGSQLVHEDVPQADNRIDLDPEIKDYHGVPAARITYSPHLHERAASSLLGARMEAWHALVAGAIGSVIIPYPIINSTWTYTAHLAGTARMGEDPKKSVCDASGRMHEVDNVYIADASTWPTYAGHNPTNTIMANSLRIARGITGGKAPSRRELISEEGW